MKTKECMAVETAASAISGTKKRFRLRLIIIVACVLLMVLLFGVAFHAVEWNMWRLIFSWNDETMDVLVDIQGKITGRGYRNDFEPACDDAFFQKLEKMDMIPLLPSKLPDGFVLERVESKIVTETYRYALGAYTFGGRRFQISVDKDTSERSGGVMSIMKDEREPEIYERGGIKFYILDNLSRSGAFWCDPPYIIYIAGHVSRDELKQMIDSMFERK